MKHSLFLIALSFLFITSLVAQKQLSNEDIWYSNTFSMDYVSGQVSMEDGAHYTRLERSDSGNAINKYSYATGKLVSTLLESKDIDGVMIDDYSFSQGESKVLIASEQEPIYRRSSKAHYILVDLKTKKSRPLSDPTLGKVQLAEYSPDGSKVAFVRANNLYYLDLNKGSEVQVTRDGVQNEIINGYADWVYEEEFGFSKGFHWSPDSKHIAYYKFDELGVREFQMAMYGSLYPNQYTFKYPKAGEDNAVVSISLFNVETAYTQSIGLGEEEHYIPRIAWTSLDNVLCITRMNRHQNKLELLTVTAGNSRGPVLSATVLYTEKSKTYIEVSDDLVFLNDNKQFLMTSDKDGYNHIYLFDSKGREKRQLTKGNWDVIEFAGLDEKTKRIFFTSSEEATTEQNLYSVSLSGKGKRRLSPQDGNNQAIFSNGYKYYTIYHSDANSPYDIKLYSNGKEIRTLVDNNGLKEVMKDFKFSQKEFFTFTTERGDELNGWQILPPNFNKKNKYPVLLAIYGGPGHNTVANSFDGRNYYWHQMLAQQGYIVMSVDPRGTYYRGRDFKNATYLQLGKLETEDMISTAKYLSDLPYIDGDRIGMQGWSFGGYLTSSCMTKGAKHFKMGIAVAPVTNWRFYDTIYTERFMQTPQENPDGYDDNSPINHVELLEGPYLLVHGSADDNVHYQNTMEMVDALVNANKEFDLFIYPNKNHGIYGGPTRLHLYNKMTDFIIENL